MYIHIHACICICIHIGCSSFGSEGELALNDSGKGEARALLSAVCIHHNSLICSCALFYSNAPKPRLETPGLGLGTQAQAWGAPQA